MGKFKDKAKEKLNKLSTGVKSGTESVLGKSYTQSITDTSQRLKDVGKQVGSNVKSGQIGSAIGNTMGGLATAAYGYTPIKTLSENTYDLYAQPKAKKEANIANNASNSLISQAQDQKTAETAKYQAMVDATYGSQTKKRGTGRPGTGLYAGMSGGASGLYNV